jgi:hypothetical protein
MGANDARVVKNVGPARLILLPGDRRMHLRWLGECPAFLGLLATLWIGQGRNQQLDECGASVLRVLGVYEV